MPLDLQLDLQPDNEPNKLDLKLDLQPDTAEQQLADKTSHYKNNFGDVAKDAANLGLPVGLIENALMAPGVVGSMLAGGLGSVAGALIPGDTAEEGFRRSSEAVTNAIGYTPRTKAGQAIAGGIGGAIEGFKEDLGEYAAQPDSGRPGAGELRRGWAAAMSAAPEIAVLAPMVGGRGRARTRGEPTPAERVKERQAQIEATRPRLDPQPEDVSGEVARLHDQEILQKLQETDRYQSLKDNLKDVVQEDAQSAIDARQAEQDLAVKRQATLDYNAAERARQEAAPTGAEANPEVVSRVPEVSKLTDRINALEEQAVKLSAAVEEKQLPKEHLERAIRDLDNLEEVRSTLIDLETHIAKDGMETRPGIPAFEEPGHRFPNNKQRGAINPEVFKEGFEKIKTLADGVTLRAFSHGDSLTITALKGGEKIGGALYEKTDKYAKPTETDLAATMVGSKQRGLATEVYKFASELGNDIVPSKIQTGAGSSMWKGFEQKGLAQGGRIKSPGNRQMGAIRLGERRRQAVERLVPSDRNSIPRDPDPRAAVEESLNEGRDSKAWNLFESGSTLAAMKRASVAVLVAARIVQNAVKRADLLIRQHVLPTEKAFRKLSKDEVLSLSELFKQEMLSNRKFDPEAIQAMSPKMQEAYANMRHMFDDTLRIQNEARRNQGKPDITAHEAYLSSRWHGDFRRPVYKAMADGTLKLVWYLAADSKRGLEKQWDVLRAEHPDLVLKPDGDHVIRFYKRQTDLQSVYSTILDILGRDDPAVVKIEQAIRDQTANEAASFLNQEKHFEEKHGIRGFVGDRPGKTGYKEALAMFQQQILYAKNAYKWSELQKSANGIKEIVSDPRLVEQQPNNVRYIKEYFKNAIGYGEARTIAHFEDAIRDLGVSPAVVAAGVGGMKSYFILSKLAVNLGYTIASLIQPLNVVPHMADLFAKGYHGEPLSSVAVGIAGGIAMATGHYANFLMGHEVRGRAPLDSFYREAFKYAEDNGITSRSIYDEAPIESAFSPVGRTVNVVSKFITVPEVYSRAITYMTIVQFLRESGKYANDRAALFQHAEEIVNASMVDYRAQERPLVFSKLGILGDFANTLQTYPANWYNQFNYFGREAAKGNPAPIATAVMMQYVIGGAMAVPFMDDLFKLYDLIKEHATDAVQYQKLMESEFWSDPKLYTIKHFGQASIWGSISDKTGLGVGSRIAAPSVGQMIQAPFGPGVDLAKQGIAAGSAILNPGNTTKLAQAGMTISPPGTQGLLETAPFMEGKTFEKRTVDGQEQKIYQRPGDLEDHKGTVTRTQNEEMLRKFGLRSQREVAAREIGYRTDKATQVAQEKANSIPDSFYDALKRNDRTRAKELYVAYTKLTGKGISSEQVEKQIRDNYLTATERSTTAARSITAITNVARMRALMKQIEEENAPK